MDPSKDHPHKHHPVIDTLHETRYDHHQQPYPNATPLSGDVTDEVLEEAGVIPLNDDKDNTKHRRRSSFSIPSSQSAHEGSTKNKAMGSPPLAMASSPPKLGLSTTATLPASGWQSLAAKSSNQLSPSSSSATSQQHEQHDKPSVLPEILPGFKGRMADIHHATASSVSGGNVVSSSSPVPSSSTMGHEQKGSSVSAAPGDEGSRRKSATGLEGGTYWTAGTMFPGMMPGFKSPFAKDEKSQHLQDQQQLQKQHDDEAHRKLSKSSILYESSNPDDESEGHLDEHISAPSSSRHTSATSSTTVQGGQGGRRWSHELSPEKAGLVGSVIEVAGLLKDVVLDKIQQHPPSTTTTKGGSATHKTLSLSEEDKEEAARLAFGGAEETGDQALYIDGLQERYGRHAQQQKHQQKGTTTAATTASTAATMTTTSQELLGSAPSAAREHHKSVFHLSGNPETMKSMQLDHPEQLGYHARDPTLTTTEESPLALQHRHGSGAD
ncbi:hypothetical protein BGZ92_004418, partial [Podila epicladia]